MYYPLSKTRGSLLQALMVIVCSSGFFLMGYDQGVFSGVIVTPYFIDTFNNPNGTLLGFVNAILDIGGAIGALSCFLFGSHLGRKKVVTCGCFAGLIGAILQATSKSLAQLLVGRIVTGVGVSQLICTIGLWHAETSSAKQRGTLMSVELTMCALGLFIAQWTNYGLGTNITSLAYVFPILFQIVFIGVTLLLIPALPESPRWLVTKGRMAEARAVLVRIGDKNATEDSEEINQMMVEIETMALLETLEGLDYFKSLIHSGPTQNGKRALMSILTFAFSQLCGVNSVTYYVPTLLITFIGVPRSSALWIGGLISIISFSSSFLPVFILDRIGRVRIMVIGAVGMGVSLFIAAGLYANLPPVAGPAAKSFGIGIVSFIYIFFAFFSSTWLGPCFVYGPEILPLKGRTTGMGLGIISWWLCNFLIVMSAPPALQNISWRFYVILGSINIAIAVIMHFFFFETKGKSLEEIDRYFAERYHGGEELRHVEQEALHYGGENFTTPTEVMEVSEKV